MNSLRTFISCLATAAAVALFTSAAPVASHAQTQTPWGCTWLWQPVCGIGKDGKKHTWANDCWAKNDGATHIKPGACK